MDITRRLDERRPAEQLQIPLFGKPLTIGGEYELKPLYRRDFALAPGAKDDLFRLDQELQLELFYPITDSVSVFVEVKGVTESRLYAENNNEESDEAIERGQMWIFFKRLFGTGLSLQIGRQSFEDRRSWWWDEDLDAIRLYFEGGPYHFELGFAEELARDSTFDDHIDPEVDDVFRILGLAVWQWAKHHRIEGYVLYQNDHSKTENVGDLLRRSRRDPSDADLWWWGIRLVGRESDKAFGRLSYWLDTAWVEGEENLLTFASAAGGLRRVSSRMRQDVRGWGIDGGVNWTAPIPWRPTFSVGYAYGSGDRNPNDRTDHAFRQTGLHENKARLRGVNRIHIYGELLRPELSNLHILTLAAGVRFLKKSSVELVYHKYRQDEAAPFLRDGRIRANPTGMSKDIGDELDLIVGIEEWKQLELEFVAAVFEAGRAYRPLDDERAYSLELRATYNF